MRLTRSIFLVYAGLFLLTSLSACITAATEWTQDSFSKIMELGGAVGLLNLEIKATPAEIGTNGVATYLLYLTKYEHEHLSMLTASLVQEDDDSQELDLEITPLGALEFDHDTIQYAIDVPMEKVKAVNLLVNAVFLHITSPLPKELEQGEHQMLLWNGDAEPRTPYATSSASVSIRTPDPIITIDSSVESKRNDNTVEFGPFNDVRAYTLESQPVAQGRVHFTYSRPVIAFVDYKRHVEVSHWGDNMATQDSILLRNVGPKLKGHFSRSLHMINMHMNPLAERVSQVQSLPLYLPSGAKDVYFVDATGNVSTSSLSPTPKMLGMPRRLDIRPRFPVLGGWNYSFTVGWNERMSQHGIARWNPAKPWRTRIAVPFLISPKTAAIDVANLTIALPEGATDIQVMLPFQVDSMETSTYPTYLDTVGRPIVSISRAKCSFMNSKVVFVEYTLPLSSYARKPLCVALAVLLVFFASAFVSRQVTPTQHMN